MKINKETRQLSRDMVRASYVDGVLDPEKVRFFVRSIVDKKPRNYIVLLQDFHRLLRLELEKRQVRIESAMALDPAVSSEIVSGLEKKYGRGLTPEYVINPGLLGGVRVRIGSDVWDSSVRNRLQRLEQQFST